MPLASELLIVGLSHHTAPVEVREQLALSNGRLQELGPELAAQSSIHEVVALSTCNRVEIVAYCEDGGDACGLIRKRLIGCSAIGTTPGSDWIFELRDREAVRHVFRVASSLDSMIVGEPQILGQLKEQFALAAETEAAGPVLHRVFHKSFAVAKRVRTETGVASRSVSVASVAVDLAGRIFESLVGATVMLIGAGEIAEAAATHLIASGVARVMVVNRTYENAVALARQFGGTPVPFERMANYLPLADLVIGSAGGGELLAGKDVAAVMRERRNRPVFFIDLAVPRNFAADINEVDGAYLYDVDDLSAVVDENMDERSRDAVAGEVIVEEEVDRFWQWLERLHVVPTIVELRDHAERVRLEEVEKTLAKIAALDARDREKIDQMTKAIVSKLLHEPTLSLKQDRSEKEGLALLSAVRELFGLGKKS
jgi:glutamyl-tRNA reductase